MTPASGSRQIIGRRVVMTAKRRINGGSVAHEIDAGQAVVCFTTVIERLPTDAADAVANCDPDQAVIIHERKLTDVGDAIWNSDAGQAGERERLLPDAVDTVANCGVGQAGEQERIRPDAGDAAGNRDAG